MKACEAALRLDPQSYEGNRVAGMCSLALHRFDDGIRYFEAAAASIEAEFMAASFASQLYVAKGDYAGAREAAKHALARIEKVIAAEPDHGRAGIRAGLLAILGETETREEVERGTLVDRTTRSCTSTSSARSCVSGARCGSGPELPVHRQGSRAC